MHPHSSYLRNKLPGDAVDGPCVHSRGGITTTDFLLDIIDILVACCLLPVASVSRDRCNKGIHQQRYVALSDNSEIPNLPQDMHDANIYSNSILRLVATPEKSIMNIVICLICPHSPERLLTMGTNSKLISDFLLSRLNHVTESSYW